MTLRHGFTVYKDGEVLLIEAVSRDSGAAETLHQRRQTPLSIAFDQRQRDDGGLDIDEPPVVLGPKVHLEAANDPLGLVIEFAVDCNRVTEGRQACLGEPH